MENNKKTILEHLEELKSIVYVPPIDITVDWINKNRPLSYSSLKHFRKSPQHYLKYITGEFVRTPAMILGSVIDILLLSPKQAEEQLFVIPGKLNLRTKADRELRDECIENNKGKLVITEEQYDTALLAVQSVYRDEDAMYYINRLKRTQVLLEWKDKASGFLNKGYVDGESDQDDQDYFIMDLKSTSDASNNKFIRQAYDLDYHLQAGGYTLGMKRKFRFPDFINIVVETSAPFGVNVFRADSKYIEIAQNEYLNTLLAFKYCIEHKEFHKSYAFHRFSTKYSKMELPGYFKSVFG